MHQKIRNVILSFFGIALLTVVMIISTPSVNSTVASDKRFQYAVKVVLEHEGGLSSNKNDTGGLTRYGISLRFIRSERIDINGDGVISKDDIIQLTETEADKIYYHDFWKKYHYDLILDKIIATKAFDMAVNAGPSRSNILLKKAINEIIDEPIDIGPILDEQTIDIINNIEPSILHDAMRGVEEEFYKSIVDHNHALAGFEKGWLKRASW